MSRTASNAALGMAVAMALLTAKVGEKPPARREDDGSKRSDPEEPPPRLTEDALDEIAAETPPEPAAPTPLLPLRDSIPWDPDAGASRPGPPPGLTFAA